MVRDMLGNEIKEGMMVMLSYNNQPTVARVAQLNPGGVIGSSRDAMPVAGMLVLQIIVPIQFQGDQINGVWVLAQPSNQDLAARDAGRTQ
jgi:hypothetical protein